MSMLRSVHQAAEVSGRRLSFVGRALTHYLEAAWREGRGPLDPKALVPPEEIEAHDPSSLVIVSTGSQGESRAALSRAAAREPAALRIRPQDLLLYSAKIIPGNDARVMAMINAISSQGARVVMGSGAGLHVSGHAQRDELEEALRLLRPQHFLPVHGETAFLAAHAALARETGVQHTLVARNGQLVGLGARRAGAECAAPASLAVVGEARLQTLYNDGDRGVGNAHEMALNMRTQLALEGIVVASVDLRLSRWIDDLELVGEEDEDDEEEDEEAAIAEAAAAAGVSLAGDAAAAVSASEPEPARVAPRQEDKGAEEDSPIVEDKPTSTPQPLLVPDASPDDADSPEAQLEPLQLRARARVATRGMWEEGRLLPRTLKHVAQDCVAGLAPDLPLVEVESVLRRALRDAARKFNNKEPEVIVMVHDRRPRNYRERLTPTPSFKPYRPRWRPFNASAAGVRALIMGRNRLEGASAWATGQPAADVAGSGSGEAGAAATSGSKAPGEATATSSAPATPDEQSAAPQTKIEGDPQTAAPHNLGKEVCASSGSSAPEQTRDQKRGKNARAGSPGGRSPGAQSSSEASSGSASSKAVSTAESDETPVPSPEASSVSSNATATASQRRRKGVSKASGKESAPPQAAAGAAAAASPPLARLGKKALRMKRESQPTVADAAIPAAGSAAAFAPAAEPSPESRHKAHRKKSGGAQQAQSRPSKGPPLQVDNSGATVATAATEHGEQGNMKILPKETVVGSQPGAPAAPPSNPGAPRQGPKIAKAWGKKQKRKPVRGAPHPGCWGGCASRSDGLGRRERGAGGWDAPDQPCVDGGSGCKHACRIHGSCGRPSQ
ncbi:hypothetical protein QBZ16_004820 [Prototheca wickerhamii]|uniref:Zn-dependent metallo-hydrolase RNA specificity domain-containing protein n=1 Tax=Prototheca wickerhamii TaxID=3111 RepID=A0AAD9IGH3_PROWI|nr:hypothetical protein QBZ16_004820 [Prototheca wickerhamii]